MNGMAGLWLPAHERILASRVYGFGWISESHTLKQESRERAVSSVSL